MPGLLKFLVILNTMNIFEHSSFGEYMHHISVGYISRSGITGSQLYSDSVDTAKQLSKGVVPIYTLASSPKAKLLSHCFGRTLLLLNSAWGQVGHGILMAYFIGNNTSKKNNNSKGNLLHT